ncbi:hypothetical protein Tco_1275923 [Tanacetum coccineum]
MENVGLTFAQVSSKAHRKGVGLRVADSHTGNHLEGGFTPFKTIRSAKDTIAVQRCGLSAKELNEFLSFYPIPSENDVILPTSTQTIFDAPPGYVGMYTHSYSLANLRLPLTDFFEPSLGFGIGSPSASVNTEPPKDVEEPDVQPAKVTADSRESLKAGVPPVKRKLASGSSSSRILRAKTSASKDDAPFLSISDEDEGLPDCFELKDANACHLKISAITPPALRGHLDNQMDLELLDLHDRCYVRERSREEECERLRAKCEADMAEFDQNPAVLALQEKISSLIADDKEHKGNLDRMMLESRKWAGHQVTLSTLELKVNSLEANKAKLEAVEASLRGEVEELKQEKRDVVSKVIPYATKAYEQVAAMKEPFDVSKFVADATALIEALLLKKPPILQKPTPSWTLMPMPSS